MGQHEKVSFDVSYDFSVTLAWLVRNWQLTHFSCRSFCLIVIILSFYLYSFLAKRGVKDEICSFDARKITPDIRASVEELLEKNANSFDPKVIWKFHKSALIIAIRLPLQKDGRMR